MNATLLMVCGMCSGVLKSTLELIGAMVLRRLVYSGADMERGVQVRDVAAPVVIRGNNG